MLCGTHGAVAAMDRAYMSLRARKPQAKTTNEQTSPFRRWTTGSGAGSSYRHHDHRNVYGKQMSEGASPSSSSKGPSVARWSLGLEQLLADPVGSAAFAHFLSKEFAVENIHFWTLCEKYRVTIDPSERTQLANLIWTTHLSDKASEAVNIDASARRNVEAVIVKLNIETPSADLFLQAQKHIFNLMKFDSYPRFLRSGIHAECARADLCGSPMPVELHDHVADTTKLKQSASNASERRRSGGSSLLPWRRGASRERAAATSAAVTAIAAPGAAGGGPPAARAAAPAAQPGVTPQPSTSADTQRVTDVLKSNQMPRLFSLCRVEMPNGSTSVVEVEESISVRDLVEKMLQRRNMNCANFDVLLKDCLATGEPALVDINAPSTVLGGREVVVERRCVVRIELGNRCVAVRCRPARRLRQVLRPVLVRYGAQPGPGRVLLRDGAQVHPDTSMQELDGARLQLVDLNEAGDAVSTRDEDADSLSELALRLQEDSRAEASSTSHVYAGPTGVSNGGLVRAALRPGPPLHHHPPDFLENLRETQRQRLQNKNEPAPAPRTPPPLPPKPSQRSAPTVV